MHCACLVKNIKRLSCEFFKVKLSGFLECNDWGVYHDCVLSAASPVLTLPGNRPVTSFRPVKALKLCRSTARNIFRHSDSLGRTSSAREIMLALPQSPLHNSASAGRRPKSTQPQFVNLQRGRTSDRATKRESDQIFKKIHDWLFNSKLTIVPRPRTRNGEKYDKVQKKCKTGAGPVVGLDGSGIAICWVGRGI